MFTFQGVNFDKVSNSKQLLMKSTHEQIRSPTFSAPVPNGDYRIVSVAHPTQDADLILGKPTGPIQGYKSNSNSTNMIWTLTNVGPDNQVTLLNKTTKTYAQVLQGIKDAQVTGGRIVTTWTLVPTKPHQYLITYGHHNLLAWKLLGGDNYAPIVLEPTIKSDTTQNWYLEAA